MVYMVIITS